MNEVSIIINGVRYDIGDYHEYRHCASCQIDSRWCNSHNFGYVCALLRVKFFKKSDKKFEV